MSLMLKVRDRVTATKDLGGTLQAGRLGTVVRIRGVDVERGQLITVWFDGLLGEHDLPAAWVARADSSTRSKMTSEDRRFVRAAIRSSR